jgi:hypothetical protein
MAMSASTLGAAMHAAWNGETPDAATYNKLGDTMYDHMLKIKVDQDSEPDGRAGRQRFRQLAKAILEDLYNASGSVSEARWVAVAGAVIGHISSNATIAPLSTTSTPAGTGPHEHNPITVSSDGKIS